MKDTAITSMIVLGIVCLLSAVLLGYSYMITKDSIDKQANLSLDSNLRQIFPNATGFAAGADYYAALNGKDIIGYAAITDTPGYSSMIKILVGMNPDKTVTGIRILDQAETAGLGTEVTKPNFYLQFSGMLSKDLSLRKYGGKIDGITGATISSKAVSEGVKNILINKLEKIIDANKTKPTVSEASNQTSQKA